MAEPMVWLPPERKGFRAFVERHDALFTVFGAGIVFIAFFMKEGVKEQHRDATSSIREYQSDFESRRDYTGIINRIEELRNEMRTKSASRGSALQFEYDNDAQRLALLSEQVTDADKRLSHANDLIDHLPDVGRKGKWLDFLGVEDMQSDLSSKFFALQEQYKQLEPLLNRLRVSDTKKQKSSRANEQIEFSKLLDTTERELKEFNVRLGKYEEEIRSTSEIEGIDEEDHVTSATHISWLLFIIGWGMGLIGKLLKVPALGGSGSGD